MSFTKEVARTNMLPISETLLRCPRPSNKWNF